MMFAGMMERSTLISAQNKIHSELNWRIIEYRVYDNSISTRFTIFESVPRKI